MGESFDSRKEKVRPRAAAGTHNQLIFAINGREEEGLEERPVAT